MIHSKGQTNSDGFTFIEVVLTVLLMGTILISLLNSQNTIMSRLIRSHENISRIFYIKNLFFDIEATKRLAPNKLVRKTINDPKTTLTIEAVKPSEKSAIGKRFQKMFLIKAKGSWRGLLREQEEVFITFDYNLKKK